MHTGLRSEPKFSLLGGLHRELAAAARAILARDAPPPPIAAPDARRHPNVTLFAFGGGVAFLEVSINASSNGVSHTG